MRTGFVLVLLYFCFTYSTIVSQNHILGRDSLELSFYPISGLENYHSENDCKISGSAWVDSLSVKINLTVKDDYLKIDKPYKKGDYVEVFFAVPELKDSSNIYITRDGSAYYFKMKNDLKKFKNEWRNPLIVFEDFEKNKNRRYNSLDKKDDIGLIQDVNMTIDPNNYGKFLLKHIPYGETNFLFFPKSKKVYNGNTNRLIEKKYDRDDSAYKIPNIESKVSYNQTIDSSGYSIQLTFPISSFAYISAKLAREIRFLVNVVDIDSSENNKSLFSNSRNANSNTFSSYTCLFPMNNFMDSLTYDRILPSKYDSTISPIFLNTIEGWQPIKKEIDNIGMVTSLIHYKTPNLYFVDFRLVTVEHKTKNVNNKIIHIFSNTDFKRPFQSKDYVVLDDSLILIVDEFITAVKLNSGTLGFVFADVYWFFGECRGGVQACGCCTLTDYYLTTEQDIQTEIGNKLKICSQEDPNHIGVSFYPTIFVDLDNEIENAFNFNNFKDNTFIMKFSNKRVVKIKVDEEKWRLIFIKNW